MRLIDADVLKEDLKDYYEHLMTLYKGLKHTEDKQICACQLTTFKEAVLRVKDAPTVDAVPVVRCKDCEIEQTCKLAQYLGENGFCSYGERKDNEN